MSSTELAPTIDASPNDLATRRCGGRALVWDSTNTAALLTARALRRRGWTVDWIGTTVSPWRSSAHFDGMRTVIAGPQDEALKRILCEHPPDALFLHGDDHVRWALAHWEALPSSIHAQLSSPEALRLALSKESSLQLAARLGVPALPTERCASPADVAGAWRQLAPDREIVLKGEGSAAGGAMASLRPGSRLDPAVWARVTRFHPTVMVQKRIRGPRVFVNAVYEHGVERAVCMHEKVATFPADFGPTAFAVTREIDAVRDYTRRLFTALEWHGPVNVEFRQDADDGAWYFMEINPRVGASMGIADAAGIDLAGAWAAVCEGRKPAVTSATDARINVKYAWGVRGMALAFRRPWRVPAWGFECFLNGNSDLAALDPHLRRRAIRLALWMARHG